MEDCLSVNLLVSRLTGLTLDSDRFRVAPSDRCLQGSPVCSGQLAPVEAIAIAVSDETMRQQVRTISNQIRAENGVQQVIAAFHQHLNIMSLKG